MFSEEIREKQRKPKFFYRYRLPYVEAVINEVFRLWPVFPIIGPRRVLHNTVLDKYTIPKDATVLLNLYSINKDHNVFPEPDKFMPERFMKNGTYEPNTYTLHFGKGIR